MTTDREERNHALARAAHWINLHRDGDYSLEGVLARALIEQESELTIAYDAIFYHAPSAMPIHRKIQTLIEEMDLMRNIVSAAKRWRGGGPDVAAALVKAVDAYAVLTGEVTPPLAKKTDFGEF